MKSSWQGKSKILMRTAKGVERGETHDDQQSERNERKGREEKEREGGGTGTTNGERREGEGEIRRGGEWETVFERALKPIYVYLSFNFPP